MLRNPLAGLPTPAVTVLCFALVSLGGTPAHAADPLPSWNEGATKQAIVDFVDRSTKVDSSEYVPPAERIATFDNDGTLWCEQPNYIQAEFLIARVKALAADHPEWKSQQPHAALLQGDLRDAISGGEQGFADLITSLHAGQTPEQFQELVREWFAVARHPRFKRPYTACVYQPMVELLAYLRASGFKTYIVTGGGTDFVRAVSEQIYEIPPEQVIGSSIRTRFAERNGLFEILRLPKLEFIDYGAGKPIGIEQFIGRQPRAAFGNSDGDLEMLQWTTAGTNRRPPHLGLLVHHTDAEREYAYDRQSPIGTLAKALDQAGPRGWTVVDMQRDWKVIFPPAAEGE